MHRPQVNGLGGLVGRWASPLLDYLVSPVAKRVMATVPDVPARFREEYLALRSAWQQLLLGHGEASERELYAVLDRVASPLLDYLTGPAGLRALAAVPPLPAQFRERYLAVRREWPPSQLRPRELPESLRSAPGTVRDSGLEQRAYETAPLQDFMVVYADAIQWLHRRMWRSLVPVSPRLARAGMALGQLEPPEETTPDVLPPAQLTERFKAIGRQVGLSAVGVAQYDRKYEFEQYYDQCVGDRVVVLLLEQNYDATQTIPSARSEQAALSTYAEEMHMAAELARYLMAQGYQAVVHGPEGQGVMIHYAVEAGLGQLGLNGQLLTRVAGSRCRIITMNTDAPLLFDEPKDFGIPKVCDACKACVVRCPVGAIPNERAWHRGVMKAKINTKRCLPVVAQVDGCAICMKVCPVQKYGLDAVVDEYESTGQILGRGTDELEGFDWPLDGRHYGPGKKPRVPRALMRPEGVPLQPRVDQAASTAVTDARLASLPRKRG